MPRRLTRFPSVRKSRRHLCGPQSRRSRRRGRTRRSSLRKSIGKSCLTRLARRSRIRTTSLSRYRSSLHPGLALAAQPGLSAIWSTTSQRLRRRYVRGARRARRCRDVRRVRRARRCRDVRRVRQARRCRDVRRVRRALNRRDVRSARRAQSCRRGSWPGSRKPTIRDPSWVRSSRKLVPSKRS